MSDTPKSIKRIKRIKWDKWIIAAGWIGRLVVGGVFLFAGVHKLLAPDTFAQDIANYQAFPHWTWNLAAAIVPILEVLGGLAVLIDFKRRAAAIVLGALNVAFIGLIFSVIWRGIDLSCGCFGAAAEADAVGWPMLLRDLALMLAIVAAYLPPEREKSRA
jgi:putative oxidoreductase